MKSEFFKLFNEKSQVILSGLQGGASIQVGFKELDGSIKLIGNVIAGNKDLVMDVPVGLNDPELLNKLVFIAPSGESLEMTSPIISPQFKTNRILYTGVPYETAPKLESIAAVTIVFNEEYFLPKWAAYYGEMLGYQNLFVIDDGSDKNPREYLHPDVNVIRQPRTSFSSWRLCRTLSEMQRMLLETYDAVLVLDSDEFVVTDRSDCKNLVDHLHKIYPFKSGRIRTVGWEVIHRMQLEPSLDVSQPISEQRRYLLRSGYFDKPIITNQEASYMPGNHNCYEDAASDTDLHMLHFRWFDYKFAVSKALKYTSTTWSEIDLGSGLSAHQRMNLDEVKNKIEEHDHQYQSGTSDTNKSRELPKKWRDQLGSA